MGLSSIKALFLRVMLGCLIAAAGVAVFAVLIGQFNEVAGRALATIFLVAVHCLLSFGFIDYNEKQEPFESLGFFTNVTFGLIVISFITSVLAVWTILPADLVGRLYAFYFVILFATLHAEMLAKMHGHRALIDNISLANYIFIAIVAVMLVPFIFFEDSTTVLGPGYYRILAAAGIIDATLTLTAIILYKLYLRDHPELNQNLMTLEAGQPVVAAKPGVAAAPQRRPMNLLVELFLIYLAIQFILPLGWLIFSFIANR